MKKSGGLMSVIKTILSLRGKVGMMDSLVTKFVSFKNLPYVVKLLMDKRCVEADPVTSRDGWFYKILQKEVKSWKEK
jgi:hypothetical protein